MLNIAGLQPTKPLVATESFDLWRSGHLCLPKIVARGRGSSRPNYHHDMTDHQISAPTPIHMPTLSVIATTHGSGDEN
jgi:hypothetical protein